MQEVFVNCNEMEWSPAENYPKGTLIKTLRDNNDRKTVVLKFPAGTELKAHSHTNVEQHYVLDGQYEIEGRIYGKGCYQLIPAGDTHGPFTTSQGATILVIWDPH